jgi:hypothetical protein
MASADGTPNKLRFIERADHDPWQRIGARHLLEQTLHATVTRRVRRAWQGHCNAGQEPVQ